jgi:SAM-dependent methyltransferase
MDMKSLLKTVVLEKSSVVANSAMNRERGITGGNSYTKELSFNLLTFLTSRLAIEPQVTWLDLCCGTGKALIEAAQFFHQENLSDRIKITGVDLVSFFAKPSPNLDHLQLLEASISDWRPKVEFDLITCVHGLHYIGDKLNFLQQAASWLKVDGIFLANLDSENLRLAETTRGSRMLLKALRAEGFLYNPKKHLISCQGKRMVHLNFDYLGADDRAGPNYTGQPVVNSYYAFGQPCLI